ncbi:hypothetical protein TRSC58_03862 [Trypanosoma rangeli SC58]|uniref:PH domain-containing protein n=1 Tax=Trypanosoma rangeli SC58 TaxID=429131 RepID=A0A061J291_TRYRA|nr:hypothetical protein TRSC58_03862 [Trypanosoma rangeli SC58]
MRSKCVEARSRIRGLKNEIEEGEKQLESVQTLMKNRQERLHTVQRELRHVQHQVKWMLECQAADEQAFRNRIREEYDYLQQLMEARNEMEAESSQLTVAERLDILPLQDDVNALEMCLNEMQEYTQKLQLQCRDLQSETEKASNDAIESSENDLVSLAYQRALESADQRMMHFMNEQMRTSRCQGVTPLLVHSHKRQWLQNYLVVWNRLYRQCAELQQEAGMRTGSLLTEVRQKIEAAKRELDAITCAPGEDTNERQTAFLTLEHLVSLLRSGQKMESELLQRVKETAKSIGEVPEAYISFASMNGYSDFTDDEEDETVMPKESTELMFKPIPEENPDLVIDEMRSLSDFSPDDRKGEETVQQTAHRSRGNLQEFIYQKSLFLSEHATRARVSLRHAVAESSPSTVEGSLSKFLEKMVDEALQYVKQHKQQRASDQIDLLHDVVRADPEYVAEAQQLQTRVRRIMLERQKSFLPLSPGGKENHSTHPFFVPKAAQWIAIEGAHLPPDVVNASAALQAKYFLSCAIRGVTTVMLTPGSVIPTVRHLFLTRDLGRLCASDVSSAENVGSTNVDVTAKLTDVHDIRLVADESLTSSKLDAELSFTIVLSTEQAQKDCWVVQADNAESRTFWAYVFAWVINESAVCNEAAIITRLKRENKVFVLDAAEAMSDNFEPSNRYGLHVQVDDK